MNLELDVTIDFSLRDGDKVVVSRRLLDALETIAHCGSIQRAAAELDVSYRHLWGQLKDAEVRLGQPLVFLERGKGSNLAPLAEAILCERERAITALSDDLRRVQSQAEAALREHFGTASQTLYLRASHDLAIEHLPDLARHAGLDVKLSFGGSLKNLQALAQGRCQFAGVHLPLGAIGQRAAREYLQAIPAMQTAAVLVMERAQGLIVRPGNPRRLERLADLARRGVRFINRQTNSGTRWLLDALLEEQGIKPADIAGYGQEEFTHFAVAAAVAAGEADAAFGLQAAAHRLRLDFVPIAQERYFLVCALDLVGTSAFKSLVAALRSPSFRAVCEQLGGYDTRDIGTVYPTAALPLD